MMSRSLNVLAVCALLLCPFMLAAQDTTRTDIDSAQAARRLCDSTLSYSVADSALAKVQVTVRRVDGGIFPPPYPGLLLQEFATRFHPPRPLRVPVFSAGPMQMRTMRLLQTGVPSLREPVLNGVYNLTVHRDATASRLMVIVPTLTSGLDSAIMSVLQQISAEQLYPFPLDEVPDDSMVVQLRLTSAHAGNEPALPLFTSYFPQVPLVDAQRIGPEPAPELPAEEREAGIFGDVRLQVVVDGSGTPNLETLEILRAPTTGLALSAVKALAEMRWTPARVGSCSVPQVVHANFRFENSSSRPDSAGGTRAP